jgi:enoyl-CoA hydratase/carnithine racemase
MRCSIPNSGKYTMARLPHCCPPCLPDSLKAERQGEVGILWLARGGKHNAFDDDRTIMGIEAYFANPGEGIKASMIASEHVHFSAEVDLNEMTTRAFSDVTGRGRLWRRAFDSIQFCEVPVVAVLHGAVIGAGLELAAAAHVRVAERSAFYALPKESLGIDLPSSPVRLARLIGVARVMDMMLTGRVYSAEEGQAMELSTYLVDKGKGFVEGLKLAERIADNVTCSLSPSSGVRSDR